LNRNSMARLLGILIADRAPGIGTRQTLR
jgi:hypothetical protein